MLLSALWAVVPLLASLALPVCGQDAASRPPPGETFDFIVVGGGTAGLAVASRLAQRLRNSRILVLEAGPDAPNELKINVPGMKGQTIGGPFDWNLTSTPQPGLANRQILQSRGKVLGGSSALNLMSWDRGSSVEYDAWADFGNRGWNFQSMLDVMLKAENFLKSPLYASNSGVGFGGPVQSMINDFVPLQQNAWIPTLVGMGVPENRVSLAGNPLGVMFQPSNIDPHRPRKRSYSAHNPGYPSVAGSNLVIRTGTRVAKINFKKIAGLLVATGVTLQDGSVITASKEVILSAGSLQSPQLLELSGIGQKAVLTAAGITQQLELPGVGEHLQDHVRIQASYRLAPNFTSFDTLKFDAVFAAAQLELYNAGAPSIFDYTGSGYVFSNWTHAAPADRTNLISLAQTAISHPLTSSPFEPVRSRALLGFTTTKEKIVPEVEVIFSDGYTGGKGYPPLSDPLRGSFFFTLIAGLMHPYSIGSVHITSSSITTAPTINPNYLAQDYDLEALVAIGKYVRRIANSQPLKSTWVDEYEPGLNVVPDGPNADEQWKQYVKTNANTIFHPIGTCAMLPKNLNGVVDPQLRVYGTKNLRIVDASVMPNLVSGHIQTAVYGIAEKAAATIIDYWT